MNNTPSKAKQASIIDMQYYTQVSMIHMSVCV